MSSDGKDPHGDEPRADQADETAPTSGGDGETVARASEPRAAKSDDAPKGDEPESTEKPAPAPPPTRTSQSDAYYEDYEYDQDGPAAETALVKAEPEAAKTPPPPPEEPTTDLDDDDDEGMKRMSFLEHLEELRTRILRSVIGLFVSFIACLGLAPQLFLLFVRPFDMAASKLPYDPPLQLTQITPTEQFMLEYVKIPLLAGIFLASPWIMYQVWAFVAPGLYRRERRWAGPFICSTASLFIAGGLFCYFIALRFALGFLIGLGFDMNVRPMISLTSYYDMFFNLHVGLGVVFQMPVVIFFFTLLRITSPAFLLRHGRYAILIIFVVAALITPTPDVTTMLTFAAPMILLYYVGIAASFLIVMKREGRQFPWRKILWIIGLSVFAVLATLAVMYFAAGFRFVESFPWFVRP